MLHGTAKKYIELLGNLEVPRLPHNSKQKAAEPTVHLGTQNRISGPLLTFKHRACHGNANQTAAEPALHHRMPRLFI